MNLIEQWHPSFHSPYQGPLRLTPQGEHALSRVFTLFTGVELTGYAEALFQLESAGGKGIGNGFGLAGFTNLDVVHNPSLGSKPYVGRTMLHFAIPLSHDARSRSAIRFPSSANYPHEGWKSGWANSNSWIFSI